MFKTLFQPKAIAFFWKIQDCIFCLKQMTLANFGGPLTVLENSWKVYIRANWSDLKQTEGRHEMRFADKLMVGNWRTTLPTHESDTKLFIGLGLYQLCCPVGRFTDWLHHGFVFFRRFLIINIFIKLSKGGN